MAKLLSVVGFVLVASVVGTAGPAPEEQLPQLNVIHVATLSPSYSCRDRDAFAQGYQQTALFVSAYSRQHNTPDLLFNGACGAADSFEASTAGDDMALIADLGTATALEAVTAQVAMRAGDAGAPGGATAFRTRAAVAVGHVYAVLINKSSVRGLLVFTVDEYRPNQRVVIRYAIKSYAVNVASDVAPGFGWEAGSRGANIQAPIPAPSN